MHATVPPAIHAPAKVCGDYTPQNINVGDSAVIHSPDCKWVVVFQSDIRPKPDFPLKGTLQDDTAAIADAKTGRIIARFEMERSVSLHWLKDNRHLAINYFAGSGATIPLFVDLKRGRSHKPVDLAALVWPSVLAHAHIPDKRAFGFNKWTYHYYVNFVRDTGDQLIISAEPWYTPGRAGTGEVRCFIYSVDKVTLKYRFVREDSDIEHCPHNPDEKWD